MQFRATHFMSSQNAIYSISSVQRTLSLRGATRRGNLPEGTPHYKTHARYSCTCVEKKAQTSIRVSVIAPDNVISKAQFTPRARCGLYLSLRNTTRRSIPCNAILCQIVCLVDTFYDKNKPDTCQRDTFRAFFNYSAIKFLFVAERLSYFRIVEKVVFIQVFFVKRLYVGLCSQPRLFKRRFCP